MHKEAYRFEGDLYCSILTEVEVVAVPKTSDRPKWLGATEPKRPLEEDADGGSESYKSSLGDGFGSQCRDEDELRWGRVQVDDDPGASIDGMRVRLGTFSSSCCNLPKK